MFITIEDETGIANIIVWPSLFERQRRLVLSARMIACRGRVQREGEVVHLIAAQFEDLTGLLDSLGSRDSAFPLRHGRGDEARHPPADDPRGQPAPGGGSGRTRPGTSSSVTCVPDRVSGYRRGISGRA